MNLTYGSLFSGVGGFDIGFDRAGYDCVFQVEWDKHCQSVLQRHWPNVPKWSDVQEVVGSELPPCDVLTFGSPCQDLSVAGKQEGLQGGRSSMFFHATRIIKEMRYATAGSFPRVAIWENVPGALSSNKGDDFAVVLDEMAECGALVLEWAVLDARWFGVPQRRRRIFLVAVFDPDVADRCGSEILPVPSRSDWNPPTRSTSGEDVAGAVGSGVAGSSGGPSDGGGSLTFTQSSYGGYTEGFGTLSATDYKRPEQHVVVPTEEQAVPYVKVIRSGARDENGDLPPEVWREEETSPTLNSFDNNSESRATVTVVHSVLSFDTQFGSNANVFEDESPTLKATQTSPSILPIPIQDARDIEKHQNGMGIGQPGDPMYTLDTTGGQGVGQESIVFEPKSMLEENWASAGVKNALRAGESKSAHVVLHDESIVFDPSRRDGVRVQGGTSNTLTSNMGTGGNNTPMVAHSNLSVRRLTPIECERLMGWPENWTQFNADGKEQSDSQRYKQCGNGVASPVATWVGKQLKVVLDA